MKAFDATGAEVGPVLDFAAGLVERQIGADRVMVQVSVNGFTQSPINFMHASEDCSGPRYLANMNGPGFAYYGQVLGDHVVFTRAVDPTGQQLTALNSMETVWSMADLAAVGSCTSTPGFSQSVGAVEIVTDPSIGTLSTPFRIQ